jgi:hypothetical protein
MQCGAVPERRIKVEEFPVSGKCLKCDVDMMPTTISSLEGGALVASSGASKARPVCNVPCGCAKFCESCASGMKTPKCIHCRTPIEAKQFMSIQ